MSQIKQKTCKSCGNKYSPWNTTQQACSGPCALDLTRKKKARAYKAETRKLRSEQRAGDKTYQLGKAQQAFNAYIRERDPQSNGCISCGSTTGRWTAGHFKTDKALRFHEDNCHGQCWWNCNSNKSGNIAEYRPALVEKIGLERVEYLEQYHPAPKFTLEQAISIKLEYRQKLKDLRAKRGK